MSTRYDVVVIGGAARLTGATRHMSCRPDLPRRSTAPSRSGAAVLLRLRGVPFMISARKHRKTSTRAPPENT